MSYNTRNPEVESTLRDVAEKIGARLPDGWGFTLLIFEYGTKEDAGSLFYISTAERETMIEAMKEFIKRNEH